jgi:hypothetical protein
MQALDHPQAQCSLAVQHLGDPATLADLRFEVARSEALLLHAELDRFQRVGRTEFVVPGLALDQRHQHVALVRLRSALLGLEDLLQPLEGALQVFSVA